MFFRGQVQYLLLIHSRSFKLPKKHFTFCWNINRKPNFSICKDHLTTKQANVRKLYISVKSHLLIPHFIRRYLILLPLKKKDLIIFGQNLKIMTTVCLEIRAFKVTTAVCQMHFLLGFSMSCTKPCSSGTGYRLWYIHNSLEFSTETSFISF